MKIRRLVMQGFGRYASRQEIDFEEALQDRSIFVVTGKTGAGKTTIFDAINFALYGEASGSSRDGKSLRSDHADPTMKTEVELEFTLRGKNYLVRRSPQYLRTTLRGGDKLVESKASAELILPDGRVLAKYQEVTREMEQILGITATQFKQLVMIPQGEFKKLLEAPSDQKESIFRKIFGTDFFQQVQKELSTQANELERSIKEVQRDRANQIAGFQYQVDNREVSDGEVSNGEVSNREVADDAVAEKAGSSQQLAIRLQELLAAEVYNIPVIQQAFDAYIARDQAHYTEITREQQVIEEKLQALQDQYSTGKRNNEKLESLAKVKQDLQVLKQQALDIKGKKAQLEQAAKASKVDAFALQYGQAKQQEEKLLQEVEELTKQFAVQQATTQACQKAYATLQAQQQEAEDWKRQLEQVQHLQTQVAAYQQVQTNIITYQAKQEQLRTQEQHLQQVYMQLEATKETVGAQVEQLQQVKEEKAVLLLAQKDVEAALAQMHQLEQEWMAMVRVQNKHQALAKEYDQVQAQYEAVKYTYETQEEYLRRNQAGILACNLTVGQPCPVCGSHEHPRKASLEGTNISEQLVAESKKQYHKVEQERQGLYEQLVRYQQEKKSLTQQILTQTAPKVLGTQVLPVEEAGEVRKVESGEPAGQAGQEQQGELQLEKVQQEAIQCKRQQQEQQQVLITSLATVERQLQQEVALKQQQMQCQRQQEQTMEQQQAVQVQLQAITVALAEEQVKGETLQAAFQGKERTAAELMQEANALATQLQAFQQQWQVAETKYRQAQSQEDQLGAKVETRKVDRKQAQDQRVETKTVFVTQYQAQGFASVAAYQEARLGEAQVIQFQQQVQQYEKHQWTLTTQQAQLEVETKDLQLLNLESFVQQLEAEKAKRTEKERALRTLQSKLDHNIRIQKAVDQLTKSIDKEEEKYRVLNDVASEVNGKNPRKLSLERYVLAAYFEEIIAAANLRFCDMTANQYELFRKESVGDGRIQQGLDLEVLDNYTGKKRGVNTLSGGEGFKASLALALGLADVVQSHTGGIQLDTMFIDEGFGTLDLESLDAAIECLVDLQNDGRVIGIISHIAELKERIPTHLHVSTTREGSTVGFQT